MSLPSLIISFIILTLLVSFVYFYIFTRSQERFIEFWGLCWVAYSFSLLFLILSLNIDSVALLGLRKIFDMANILFLLLGAYAFMHTRIPSYWYRFSLYLTLWLLLGIYYNFDFLSIYLPISIYQVIITAMLCTIVIKYWAVSPLGKGLSVMVFILWGMGKAVMSILEIHYASASHFYLAEIIFSNILSFCIFIIYLEKSREEVAIGERLYRIIAENATDVIFFYTLKPSPSFSYVTPSVENLIGYTPEDFYRNPKFYLEFVSPEYFDSVEALFRGEISSGSMPAHLLIHKNGSTIWGEFNSSILYEKGAPAAIEGILRDVTHTKEAETQLLYSKQARDQFLSSISHELKTPITSILGYINAINDGTLSSEEEKKSAMDIITAKALTLEHLINDLFQLSKLETNQFSFAFMHMSALELSDQLADKYALDIKTASLVPMVEIDHFTLSRLHVIVDPKRIEQVFSNIIYNAIKFSSPNGTIKIKFGSDKDLQNYIITISDEGQGIAQEDIPYIFDRFFQSNNPPQSKIKTGSGLGLTISKEIISAHRGEIFVESDLGKGSTFTFTIPVYSD